MEPVGALAAFGDPSCFRRGGVRRLGGKHGDFGEYCKMDVLWKWAIGVFPQHVIHYNRIFKVEAKASDG